MTGAAVNNRVRLLLLGVAVATVALGIVVLSGLLGAPQPGDAARHLPVSPTHPFGTDRLGRDMLARTLAGARVSLAIGALAALGAALIAVVLAVLATAGSRWLERFVSWLIDVTLGLPSLILMILVAFATGGGVPGTVLAIAVSHWPQLARVLRAEILAVRSTDYVAVSRGQGRSPGWIARHHFLPAVTAHALVGVVVLLPGAVIHETSLTFLGLGVGSTDPSLGVIFSESMAYLSSGHWWLVMAPVVLLVAVTLLLDRFGDTLRQLLAPETRHH